MIDLSVIIVSYNTKDLTCKCLESIYKNKWNVSFEVILVDNASSDDTVRAVKRKFGKVNVIESETNLGFAGGNNLGLGESRGSYCLLLNSDTQVLAGSLDKLVQRARSENFGVLSAKLLNTDGTFQANGGRLPSLFSNFVWISGLDDVFEKLGQFSYQIRRLGGFENGGIGWVSATAMLISRQVLEKIGFLDDKIFMYAEDVDYCLRASKSGFKVGWCRDAEIIHLGGGSSKTSRLVQWRGEVKGLMYVYLKHFGFLKYLIFRVMILPFLLMRVVAFLFLGRFKVSLAYAKIVAAI